MRSLLLSLLFPILVHGIEYHVDKKADNQVTFISDAPLEEFRGVTGNIDGYVLWQDDDMIGGSEFYFEVDLTTLDTGIGLRNRHMQEHYLETEKYRYAVFSGRLCKVVKDSLLHVEANGVFKLHGRERPLTLLVDVRPDDDDYLAETQFTTALSDYEIKVPKLMFMKIDNDVKVQVKVTLKKIN